MNQDSQGGEWIWVTHFLAIFFAVVCMGIVIDSIVGVDDINIAKATMGFTSALLGVILGFYFNRERLTKESKGKDVRSSQYSDLLASYAELMAEHEVLLNRIIGEVEEEPEED